MDSLLTVTLLDGIITHLNERPFASFAIPKSSQPQNCSICV
jgi:hypothetical protein